MITSSSFQVVTPVSQTAKDQAAPTVEKALKPTGRPSTYTEKVGTIICDRIANGESLRSIARDPKLPGRETIYRWRDKNSAFDKQYTRAREMLYEGWADEIIEIADDSTTDLVTKTGRNGATYEAVDQEHIQRSRLKVDTRKWLLSKLLPKQYGDRVEVEHGGEVTHNLQLSDRERMRRFALFMLEDRAAGAIVDGELAGETGQVSESQPGNMPKAHSSPHDEQ